MDIGSKVEVIDTGFYDEEDNVKVGDTGVLVNYGYTIEKWWEEGHPLDNSVTVKFRDGRYGRCVSMWTSDLREIT